MTDCRANPKLWVIGMGPGNVEEMSLKAYRVLQQVDAVVGYQLYLELLTDILNPGQEIISTGMKRERERAEQALALAASGKEVAIVSSGDAGIYGMAGLVLELKQKKGLTLKVEVVAGITAASAAAALLGAPLMQDCALISLSDLLIPWSVIAQRLELAARADLAIALYNPRSSKRITQLERARAILLKYLSAHTPVGIVRNASRAQQEKVITTLDRLLDGPIDMFTVILIGNSQTFSCDGLMITPRGYQL